MSFSTEEWSWPSVRQREASDNKMPGDTYQGLTQSGFNPQHPHGGPQLSEIPVFKETWPPLKAPACTWYTEKMPAEDPCTLLARRDGGREGKKERRGRITRPKLPGCTVEALLAHVPTKIPSRELQSTAKSAFSGQVLDRDPLSCSISHPDQNHTTARDYLPRTEDANTRIKKQNWSEVFFLTFKVLLTFPRKAPRERTKIIQSQRWLSRLNTCSQA